MSTTARAEHGRCVGAERSQSVTGDGRAPDCRTALRALLIGALIAPVSALSGVVQQVETRFTPAIGAQVVDSDEIFGATSDDIDRDILARIGSPGQYDAVATAGRFGQVGLRVSNLSAGTGSTLVARVLVGSDEFVNLTGRPVRARTQFIVDGGHLFDAFSIGTTVTFELHVGAENRGTDGPLSNLLLPGFAENVAVVGDLLAGGGSYTATLATDAAGRRSFESSIDGGLDLRATYDDIREVDIPLSVQTLDLGVLQPNERLLIGYLATITITQNGAAEGISGSFSDPFTLSGEPNPLFALGDIVLTPVPEPHAATMLIAGLLAVTGWQFRRNRASGLLCG